MSAPLRVLHVAQPVEAGVARCVVQLVEAQVRRGWQVAVACPGGWSGQATAEVGAEVLPWSATRAPGPSVPGEVLRLARSVRSWAPHVVHLHSAKAGLAGRLALRGRHPTLFQPHAWSFEATGPPVRALAVGWERWAARWTDLLVCVSEAERDRGLAAGVRGRYAIAPNGVDLSEFGPADMADRSRAREELGLTDVPCVVCLGRLSPQKGQDVAVRAWSTVRAAVPGARLLLVGPGPGGAVTAETGLAPGVELVGATDEPRRWLAAADVVLVPSRWEGQPLVVLEAMATARSVVASDVDGVAESLGAGAHPGKPVGGVVVPPENPAALAEALVPRLRNVDHADAEGRAGRRWAETHHALPVSLARSLTLTESIARGARGRPGR